MEKPKPGRGTSRFQASLTAQLSARGADHPCEAHNLSRTGTLLVGAVSGSPGELVRVTLRSVGGDLIVEVAASVVRFETGDAGEGEDSRLAVEFRDLDDASRDKLELLVARVVEGGGPTALDGLSPNAPADQVRAALEKIPLSHRIALAARAIPRERALLLHDPHPQVLEALTRNPQLLETELRQLLRTPLLLPSTLEALAREPRWRNVENVRIAIAAHQSTTFPVAEGIANTLNREGLQKLLSQGALSEVLRRKIVQKLSPR